MGSKVPPGRPIMRADERQTADTRYKIQDTRYKETGARFGSECRQLLKACLYLVSCIYFLTCPSPSTMNFTEVRPSRPTGPRACSLSVEMPISAPRPYSKPSAKRVEAFTITELESTSRRKRRARVRSSVTMLSVCCEQ